MDEQSRMRGLDPKVLSFIIYFLFIPCMYLIHTILWVESSIITVFCIHHERILHCWPTWLHQLFSPQLLLEVIFCIFAYNFRTLTSCCALKGWWPAAAPSSRISTRHSSAASCARTPWTSSWTGTVFRFYIIAVFSVCKYFYVISFLFEIVWLRLYNCVGVYVVLYVC